MNKKHQLQFAHRCAVLLESGISLAETLSIILRMEKNKRRRQIITEFKESVEKGTSLSKSLAITRAKFDPMLCSMISYGESSGILAMSLRQASEMMENDEEIKKKLIGALVYPGFIALATAGMTLFLVMYIFPKIMPLFLTMNIKLPLLTRLVRRLYEILLSYGLVASITVLLVIYVLYLLYRKHVKVRRKTQLTLLATPIIGTILQKYYICISCKSSATLLDCGQPLPKVLSQLTSSSALVPYIEAWDQAKRDVEKGAILSGSIRRYEAIFPTVVPDMLAIGERTGSLSSIFHHIARMYEQELENFIKQLSTSIEPILMIIMGLFVGSIALSIILPIYEVTNHLSK